MPPPAASNTATMDKIVADLGIRRRAAWGAPAVDPTLAPDWNYTAIVIHNSGHGHLDTMLRIQKFQQTAHDWTDIAYHYGIMPDGTIFEGRQLIYKASDVKGQNTGKIGIVCVGDYDASIINWFSGRAYAGDPALPQMLESVRKLSRRLMAAFPSIVYFGGHIEYGDTFDCPGNVMLPYMTILRREFNLQVPVKRPGL